MKDYNIFEPILDNAERYGQHYFLLGKKGQTGIMYNDVSRWMGDKNRTMGFILLYDKQTMSLDWKAVYKNTKGLYFKKGKNYYIK